MKQVEFEGVTHEFPDDFTDDEIAAELAKYRPSPELASMRAITGPIFDRSGTAPTGMPMGPMLKRAFPSIAGTMAGLAIPALRLPRFAGMMTGLARGAASAGAGAGAAAMTGQDPKRAAIEQGGAAVVGEGLARGATGAAKGLMRSALRPTVTLQRQFPNVDLVGSALKEGVKVGSQEGREGSKELAVRVLRSSNRLNKRLAAADAAGYRKSAADLAANAIKKAEKELGRSLTTDERKQLIVTIRDEANQLLADRRFGIALPKKTTFNASEIKKVKQAAQEKARTIISAEQRGVNTGTSPQLSRSLSRGAWSAMPPSARPIEANTQRLIATQRALEGAEMRNPLPPQMTTLRGNLMRPFETPQFQSGLALRFNSPLARILALGGPRAATLALDEFIPMDDETP